MNKTKAYQSVMYFWVLVFFCVGLMFLLTPSSVFQAVNGTAAWLGFVGTIEGSTQSLWYVLALSYMACIILLSFFAARRPHDFLICAILVVAKIVSSVGFFWLAVTVAPVWLVCAIADGFVALTIVFMMPKKI